MTINTCLKLFHPLMKYGYQCLEWNILRIWTTASRSASVVRNFVPWSILFTWPRRKSGSALGPVSKADVVHSSGCSRPDIVSLTLRRVAWHCQRVPPISSISCVAKSPDLWKNTINKILIRPLLPLGQNIHQVEPMCITDHSHRCFWTAGRFAFNRWGSSWFGSRICSCWREK
jgi:hypothetical protein